MIGEYTLGYAELEQAVYARLADFGAQDHYSVYGALDVIPANPAFPHVSIEMPISSSTNTSNTVSDDVAFVINVVTRAKVGMAHNIHILKLVSLVTKALTSGDFLLPDPYVVVGVIRDTDLFMQPTVYRDDDNYEYRQMALRYRFELQTKLS